MDGEHAHALRLDLHVALDFDIGGFDLSEKIVKRRRLALLMRQRQGQEFVDRVGGFGSEPADQRSPAAVLPEEARIKGEGRKRLRPLAPRSKPARGFDGGTFIRAHERVGERTAPSHGNLQERVVVKTDQRRLER